MIIRRRLMPGNVIVDEPVGALEVLQTLIKPPPEIPGNHDRIPQPHNIAQKSGTVFFQNTLVAYVIGLIKRNDIRDTAASGTLQLFNCKHFFIAVRKKDHFRMRF